MRKGFNKKDDVVNTVVSVHPHLLINNGSKIFKAKYAIKSADNLWATVESIYCYRQHDFNINSVLTDARMNGKKIKNINIYPISEHGDSIAEQQPIKLWKFEKNDV